MLAVAALAVVALGAGSVACPSLGAGVKGWRHTTSAALGLEALAQLVAAGDAPREVTSLSAAASEATSCKLHATGSSHTIKLRASSGECRKVTFVVGGFEPIALRAWRATAGVARAPLGDSSASSGRLIRCTSAMNQ